MPHHLSVNVFINFQVLERERGRQSYFNQCFIHGASYASIDIVRVACVETPPGESQLLFVPILYVKFIVI